MPADLSLTSCNHLQLDRSVNTLSTAITDLFARSSKVVQAPTLEPSPEVKTDYILCSRRHGIMCRSCGLMLKNPVTYNTHLKRCPANPQ